MTRSRQFALWRNDASAAPESRSTGNKDFLWYHDFALSLGRARAPESLERALPEILRMLLERLEARGGALRIQTEARGGPFMIEAAEGLAPCFEKLDITDCACAAALEQGELVVTRDLEEAPCRAAGASAVLCAPIPSGSGVCGILLAGGDDAWNPPPQTQSVLRMALALLGQAVDRALEARRDHKMARDMETVNTIGQVITARLTLKDMAHEIVSRLGHVLETDEVNVILYDSERGELSFLASYVAEGDTRDRPEIYPVSDGMNSWIVRNRAPLLMTHDTVAECAAMGIRHGGRPARSWLGAPMIYKDKVVGVLSVQSYHKAGLYDRDSVALIEAVANQCAVAVVNALLFGQIIEREQEKERLYFSLTHDLLSLISPIAGFAKILKTMSRSGKTESIEDVAGHIQSATEKITRFAEDILVYAKIQSGKLALDIARRDVFESVEPAVRACLPEFELRDITVRLNGQPVTMSRATGGSGAHFVALETVTADLDRGQMERVFLNLIGNAVKHARSRIDVTVEADDTRVRCRVSDDGEGASPEQVERLFDEYYQGDGKKKGVGLGLPAVKKIVELHQGDIRVITSPGEGFAIEFSWPRTLADREGGTVARQSTV